MLTAQTSSLSKIVVVVVVGRCPGGDIQGPSCLGRS